MKQSLPAGERPNYGIDAPYVIRNLLLAGLICGLIALASPSLRWFFTPAISFLATAAVWFYNSKFGKLRVREKLIDRLRLSGNETLLDVGCGSGLLLIGAAKRLPHGMAVGVDIWRREDLSNNRRQTTLRNARLEGVAERVTVEEGDARQLPFGAAAFDAVISLNALHNMAPREERERALTEIVRVLKPGGACLIADFRNTDEYAWFLRKVGMENARRELIGWVLFFPVFAAAGRKDPAD